MAYRTIQSDNQTFDYNGHIMTAADGNPLTYDENGQLLESGGALVNPFMFSGQFFDDEIDQYHLRARQYYPYIARFTSRDPVFGKFDEPITLHKYLYCGNNPINKIDPSGLWMVDRWQGHVELTYRSMHEWGFNPEEIAYAIAGNVWTDYREDHSPVYLGGNPVPHYGYGYEAEAEAHASGAMEFSLAFGQMGDTANSMFMLGTALHTLQDRWAHAEQGLIASTWFPGHYPGALYPCPWPDWAEVHRDEYRNAYLYTQGSLLTYKQYRSDRVIDIDRSGTIGNGYIQSPVRGDVDFGLTLVELGGRIANSRYTDWLED